MKTQPNEATVQYSIEQFRGGHRLGPTTDDVAVEAPLEIRVDGHDSTILMRTPGHDEELILGFLFNESVIRSASDVLSIERPAEQPNAFKGQSIEIRLTPARSPQGLNRSFLSSSSCGSCGKSSIDSLAIAAPPVVSQLSINSDLIMRLPDQLKAAQSTFHQTGGVHASGLFTPEGDLIAIREDVGRHNALDKLIGWALGDDRLPLNQCILMLSGRISYELVQKAVMASIPIVAAVGAPSSMAIDIADRYGITLTGFVRPDSLNAYTHATRIRR
ncbi:formate dehydrogenase accessory sulfurtransferase FdhD [bacterium]|nr:formate dehydrogenase accessory sulfurtransferase FdhD [bacterium]